MKKLVPLLAALFLAATAFAAAAKVTDISHDDLLAAVSQKSAVILDVNGSDSFKAGHIPGAIDYIANKDRIAELLPKDKDALVVAYCANPACHAYAPAANAAVALGYTNVKHYAPGIAGWEKSGAPTEKD